MNNQFQTSTIRIYRSIYGKLFKENQKECGNRSTQILNPTKIIANKAPKATS
jgi:hypothetical protein